MRSICLIYMFNKRECPTHSFLLDKSVFTYGFKYDSPFLYVKHWFVPELAEKVALFLQEGAFF